MMKSILPFTSALSGASNSPSRFIAISTDAPDGRQFQSITPRVMKWSESIYLLDIGPVLQYWGDFAKQEDLTMVEYLLFLLEGITQSKPKFTLAPHPWQALLLLSKISDRPAIQFLDAQSHLGGKSLTETAWNEWISLCYELQSHRANSSLKARKENKSSVSRGSLVTLSKTIKSMQLTHIQQMADVDSPAMKRRFGALAALAWDWTWNLPKQENLLGGEAFQDDFPWKSLRPIETAAITRLIETPLRNWDHIAPLLCEDLDKLCNLSSWSYGERVVSLEWELSFSCSPSLHIPVLFRHPHALHRESGHHKTALLQAFHSWEHAHSTKRKQASENDIYIDDDSITEWKITVHEKLTTAPQLRSLFSDDLSTEMSQLFHLENSLPVPLIEYSMTDHWSPERSFHAETLDSKTITFGNMERLAIHQRRPLFIYDEPLPLNNKHESSGLIFCERVATTWWSEASPSSINRCRDYYIRMTDDGLLQWVFQNDDGSFKLHGVFG